MRLELPPPPPPLVPLPLLLELLGLHHETMQRHWKMPPPSLGLQSVLVVRLRQGVPFSLSGWKLF